MAGRISHQSTSKLATRLLSTVSSPEASSSKAIYYRITLRRSAIGLPEKTKATLASLGLRKRLQSVYLPQRSDIAGMILAVKELVHVENVKPLYEDEDAGISQMQDVVEQEAVVVEEGDDGGLSTSSILTQARRPAIWLNEQDEVVDWGGRQARKAPRGYTVVGNVSNALRNEAILEQTRKETM